MVRRRAVCQFGALAIFCGLAVAQVTSRVSVGAAGVQANEFCSSEVLSSDGRFVAFQSRASTLVPGDTNGKFDVFVRDRLLGTTEIVSVALGGGLADGDSFFPAISADGRYVAFQSDADNLVVGDTNHRADVFVRDRLSGTTERVDVDSSGGQADEDGLLPGDMSPDGRYVSFYSRADNLVPGDTNGAFDVFVHDRTTGITERVTVDSSEVEANGDSDTNCISSDGRFVAFSSYATNLGPVQAPFRYNVFLRDRLLGTTELVSITPSGVDGNADSLDPSISADGRFVSFWSAASDLVPGDTNGFADTFLRDRQAGTTEIVSLDNNGVARGAGLSSITADGRYVLFASLAPDLVPGDTNGASDVFLRDRVQATTVRVSVASDGRQSNRSSTLSSVRSITPDSRFVAFISLATNLVSGDTNNANDVYLRDAMGGPSFASICEPGVGSVAPCPCSDPPAGPGSGCDNSSSTGGANLAAAGGTILSSDSLAFSTSGEIPSALSILLQGNALITNGLVYGQGVRCVGGALKRLFTKTAVAGSITAPDFGAGDLTVSARSASRGDVIQPGQSRWYLVYYRDPIVLGGCPASSTFNATQTGEVSWSP